MTAQIFKLWIHRSFNLLLGTLVYNLFSLFLIQPILKRWFPPLSTWEKVSGFFTGSTRMTYQQLVPHVSTAVWILGNGLLFALLRRELRETKKSVGESDHKE